MSKQDSRPLGRESTSRKPRNLQFRFLTQAEQRLILDSAKDDPSTRELHNIVTFASEIGLRANELRNLRWVDVDLRNCRLVVNGRRSCSDYVPFGQQALRILEGLRNRYPGAQFVLGASPTRAFRRLSRQLYNLTKRLGLERLRYPAPRNTFLTDWVNSGGIEYLVALFTGMKSHSQCPLSWRGPDQQHEIAAREQANLEEKE